VSSVVFPADFELVRLERLHARTSFDCGEPLVTDWLQSKALQHQDKRLSVTKVLLAPTGRIAGFYSLAIGQVDFSDLPSELARKLPRRALPIAVLAWLGVDLHFQRQRIGQCLVAQALKDCDVAGQTFAFIAVVIDCVNENAKSFYRQWDFAELPGHPFRLFLSAKTLAAIAKGS